MTDLGPITKVTANFTDAAVAALEAAAEQTGDTKTDTINLAVQVYARIVQLHDAGRGTGRFQILADIGFPILVEVNRPRRPWWRFW